MNKILLIRRIFQAEDRVVDFIHGGHTLCPVCQFLGFAPGKVTVDRTDGELRYCTCEQCGATFHAIGPTRAELRIIAEKELTETPPPPPKISKSKKKHRR